VNNKDEMLFAVNNGTQIQ